MFFQIASKTDKSHGFAAGGRTEKDNNRSFLVGNLYMDFVRVFLFLGAIDCFTYMRGFLRNVRLFAADVFCLFVFRLDVCILGRLFNVRVSRCLGGDTVLWLDRKSTRLNSSH